MAIYSSILPEKFRGQRSLVGYSSWSHKSRTRLSEQPTHTHTLSEKIYLGEEFLGIGPLAHFLAFAVILRTFKALVGVSFPPA